MPKRKRPAKQAESEDSVEPQTPEKAELVLPARQPTLFHALQALRDAVGAVLDLADAAADALTKSLDA